MSDPTGVGASSVSLDEMEQQLNEQQQDKSIDLSQVKLDGDDVPDDLKGKSVKEIIEQLKGTGEALRMSEAARLQGTQQPQVQPQPQPEPEPEELTQDQIREMYEQDPVKAIEAMNAQAARRAEKNFEARIKPLIEGSAAQVEAAARVKYAEEFELFGAEISSLIQSYPQAKALLANPKAWDDLVAIVRGRPGNFERLVERKMQKMSGATPEAARAEQRQAAGFTASGTARSKPAQGGVQLDPLQEEIRLKMGHTVEEYIKWMRMS